MLAANQSRQTIVKDRSSLWSLTLNKLVSKFLHISHFEHCGTHLDWFVPDPPLVHSDRVLPELSAAWSICVSVHLCPVLAPKCLVVIPQAWPCRDGVSLLRSGCQPWLWPGAWSFCWHHSPVAIKGVQTHHKLISHWARPVRTLSHSFHGEASDSLQ